MGRRWDSQGHLRSQWVGDNAFMPTDDMSLGATLRAWRERLGPSAVGLPDNGARRTAGLRREEVAGLAGLSVDYLVRLEQGRAEHPSAQVAAALARALQLTNAQRDHLHRLARLAPPLDQDISDHISPGVQRMLNRLGDAAVAVFAADWQLIWWNRGWAALLGDPSATPLEQRNFARDTFMTDERGPRLSHWPVTSLGTDPVEAAIVSDLRRATGRFPNSRRLKELIALLTANSERFVELWASGVVGTHREDQKVVERPGVGAITVDCDVLTDGDAERKIVIITAEPGTEDETKLRLAILSGLADCPQPESTDLLGGVS